MPLARMDPREAYRISEIDARLDGAPPGVLLAFCLGEVAHSIGDALMADARGNVSPRGRALTRALTALTALEMGVDRSSPLAEALLQVYGAARRTLLDGALVFERRPLEAVRADFVEIMAAMNGRGG